MSQHLLIAGGGIGGLATALAARRARWDARVFEQAAEFSEAGAGIQLGPNATRILREWGLLPGPLADSAARPARLRVRDALDGRELGVLPLADFEARYGAPYLTLHRADLQQALLAAARAAGAWLHPGRRVEQVRQEAGAVSLRCVGANCEAEGDALVAADGVWSQLRKLVAGAADPPPRVTGHVAWRALLRQAGLPAALRSDEVTAWLAPGLHLVSYPVRGGEWLNVVCLAEGMVPGDPRDWDQGATLSDLHRAVAGACAPLRERIAAVDAWRLWALHARPPLRGASGMAAGRVALLGDAAHPMLPYLAQGAGMALEDAREIERVLNVADPRVLDVPTALRRYALSRWQRCARVQSRALRNGTVFHASGPLRLARNLSMRTAGGRLMDMPWLYGH